MMLYHGSNVEIEEIDLTKCKPYKDFGSGFYLTTIKEQAIRMAENKTAVYGGTPVVTIYETDDSIMENPRLNTRTFALNPTIEWARFVVNNRSRDFNNYSSIDCNSDCKYEVVFGPVADDAVAATVRRFLGENSVRKEWKPLKNYVYRGSYEPHLCLSQIFPRIYRLVVKPKFQMQMRAGRHTRTADGSNLRAGFNLISHRNLHFFQAGIDCAETVGMIDYDIISTRCAKLRSSYFAIRCGKHRSPFFGNIIDTVMCRDFFDIGVFRSEREADFKSGSIAGRFLHKEISKAEFFHSINASTAQK